MAKSTRLLQRALNNVLRRIEKIVSGSNGDVDHLLMQAPELEKLLTIHRAIEVATGASTVAASPLVNLSGFLAAYNQHTHLVSGSGEISGPPREPLTLSADVALFGIAATRLMRWR